MDALERDLLLKIADLHGIPEGAYNIRENGKPAGRRSTATHRNRFAERRKIRDRYNYQTGYEKRKRAYSRHFKRNGL